MKFNLSASYGAMRRAVTPAIIACSLAAMCGCSSDKGPRAKEESINDIQKREGVPVRVAGAAKSSLSVFEIAGGTAEGYFQTTLTSGMPGTITAVNVKIGDYVRTDSSLMRIDPNTPQNYTIAKQQYDNAAKSRERIKSLAAEGAVSQQIIDDVDVGYNAALEGLNIVRKNQFVMAPFGGTVVNIFQTVNSAVYPGTELVTIADIKKIKITFTVSDLAVNKYARGQKVWAFVDGDSIEGRIDRVPLAGDRGTHTFDIDALFDNSDHRIKPGMYLKLRVVVEEKNDVITLPIEAIIIEGDRQSAFVVNNGLAKKIPVTVGARSGDLYEVTDGITEGEQVVVSGASLLADGLKVKVVR